MPFMPSRGRMLSQLRKLLPFPRLGVRGLVIAATGEILLVRHTYVDGWYLPGGGVDKGEAAESAMCRELMEEASIEVLERPRLHGLFLNSNASPRDHVACYVIRAFRQIAPHVPDLEIAEARFFAADALPVEATRATLARIGEVLSNQSAAETW
jgi:ADP-ribose pyrophosphatase YjhB (NUDIX family)